MSPEIGVGPISFPLFVVLYLSLFSYPSNGLKRPLGPLLASLLQQQLYLERAKAHGLSLALPCLKMTLFALNKESKAELFRQVFSGRSFFASNWILDQFFSALEVCVKAVNILQDTFM